MRISSVIVGAALAICSGSLARAGDVEIRITSAGLDFVAKELPGILPSSISVGGGTLLSTTCPWGAPFEIKGTNVKITRIEFPFAALTTSNGKVNLSIDAANVKSKGELKVAHALCVGGALDCDFDVSVAKARVAVTFVPQIRGNEVKLLQPTINTTVASSDVTIDVTNCGNAGEVLDKAESLLHTWFVDQLKGWLEDMAIEQVPPELERMLSALTEPGGLAAGFQFDAAINGVNALNDGLHLSGALAIGSKLESPCQQSPTPAPAKSGSAIPAFAFSGDHVGVALSHATVKNAFIAAWEGGWLCYPWAKLESMGWDSKVLGAAAALFGLYSLDSVDAYAPQVPDIQLVAGTPGRAAATLPGFTIVATGQGPNGPAKITAIGDVSAEAEIGIHPENRAVSLIDAKTSFSNLQLSVDNPEGLTISEALFKDILTDAVLPLVETKIAGIVFLPHVFHDDGGPLQDYWLYLTRSTTTEHHGYLYGKLWHASSPDKTAPNTTFKTKVPALLKPKMLKVVVEGTDNATPPELLRYMWRVNGGEWSEGRQPFTNAFVVQLTHGKNIIEAKALDLQGNVDPSPAKVEIEVDGEPPELTVEPPPATIDLPTVRIPFLVSDGHTPPEEIKVMLQLLHEAEAGRSEVVREDPFIKGVQAVELSQLVRGTYTVTLVAEDAVGNKSDPVSHSFVVDLPEGFVGGDPGGITTWEPAQGSGDVNGGCHIGGGPRIPLLPLLLFGLWATAARRRRAP